MGITKINQRLLDAEQHIGGTVICLGVPVMESGIEWTEYFKSLGYDEVLALDVGDFEGAQITHDLNNPIPDSLKEKAHLVVNCGTLEHIFDVKTAMENIHAILKVGGVIMHHTPSNGYIDHGFFQLSPTLFVDYYTENGYDIQNVQLVTEWMGFVRVEGYSGDIYRNKGWRKSAANYTRTTTYVTAMKTHNNPMSTPQQGYYGKEKIVSFGKFSYQMFSLKRFLVEVFRRI